MDSGSASGSYQAGQISVLRSITLYSWVGWTTRKEKSKLIEEHEEGRAAKTVLLVDSGIAPSLQAHETREGSETFQGRGGGGYLRHEGGWDRWESRKVRHAYANSFWDYATGCWGWVGWLVGLNCWLACWLACWLVTME